LIITGQPTGLLLGHAAVTDGALVGPVLTVESGELGDPGELPVLKEVGAFLWQASSMNANAITNASE